MSLQEIMDKGTSGTLAFGGGDADNRARTVLEEIFGDTGFVLKMKWGYARTPKNYIIGRIISLF